MCSTPSTWKETGVAENLEGGEGWKRPPGTITRHLTGELPSENEVVDFAGSNRGPAEFFSGCAAAGFRLALRFTDCKSPFRLTDRLRSPLQPYNQPGAVAPLHFGVHRLVFLRFDVLPETETASFPGLLGNTDGPEMIFGHGHEIDGPDMVTA